MNNFIKFARIVNQYCWADKKLQRRAVAEFIELWVKVKARTRSQYIEVNISFDIKDE